MKRLKIKNRSKDKRIFRTTAQKMNTMNVKPVVQRGGTRL